MFLVLLLSNIAVYPAEFAAAQSNNNKGKVVKSFLSVLASSSGFARAAGHISLAFSVIISSMLGPFVKEYAEYLFKSPQIIISSSKNNKTVEQEMILPSQVKSDLDDFFAEIEYVIKQKENGDSTGLFPNLLLCGSSGTGKTMCAEQKAHQLYTKHGIPWIMVTGSAFFQDRAGIWAVNDVFIKQVKKNKKKPTLIIIDEVESLLHSRKSLDPSSESYRIINQFLALTGKKSSDRIILMTSNYVNNIDQAISRRVDYTIKMPLPSQEERAKVIRLYVDKMGLVDKVSTKQIKDIAARTKEFSPSDLSNMTNQFKIKSANSGLSSEEILDVIIKRSIQKKDLFNKKDFKLKQ